MLRSLSILAFALILYLLPLSGGAQHTQLSSEQNQQNRIFVRSAMFASPESIKERLKAGAKLEFAIENGERALMEAAKWGRVDTLQTLLTLGAYVDARDNFGRTALFYAVQSKENALPKVTALLDAGAKVDATDRYGTTPLKLALMNKATMAVEALKQRGAHDALVEATLNDDQPALRTALARKENAGSLAACSAAETAVLCGKHDILLLLLSYGVDPNTRNGTGQTLLIQAAEAGDLAIVQALLAHGAEVNAQDNAGYNALMSAHGEASAQLFQLLLDKGAQIDAQDQTGATLLMHAAWQNMPLQQIRLLLAKGAKPNLKDHQGNTALIHLLSWTQAGYDIPMRGRNENDAEAVKALVAGGADVDVCNSEGITPLMRAAGWHHTLPLKTLLASGAKIDLQDNLGRTALTWAAGEGRKSESVQALLHAGARIRPVEAMLWDDFPTAQDLLEREGDTSARGPLGETLLMIAAEKGERDLVSMLLKRGSDSNARDNEGMTALMLAVAGRAVHRIPSGVKNWPDATATKARTQIVQALLLRHADPNLRNTENDTALSIAKETRNASIISLLNRHGAQDSAPAQNGKNR